MEPVLLEMFEQARKLVVETDRRLAEENDRIREKEREAKLVELSHLIEASFDFTSKEKLELDPRLDLQDGNPQWNLLCAVCGRFSLCRPKLTVFGLSMPWKMGGSRNPWANFKAAPRVMRHPGGWPQPGS